MLAWLTTNWMEVLVALLAVDRVLITLFPNTTVFAAVASTLTGLGAK